MGERFPWARACVFPWASESMRRASYEFITVLSLPRFIASHIDHHLPSLARSCSPKGNSRPGEPYSMLCQSVFNLHQLQNIKLEIRHRGTTNRVLRD